MSREGDGHRSAPGSPSLPGVMTVGTATVGDVLAERYRLEGHVDTDRAARQIWRGIDVVLRRPVAVVIQTPGGEAAGGMITAAVATSRLVHPHLVAVYDAIDEHHRAYLIREWVPGVALRDVLAQAPLDAERATLVTHAIAEAVAALHSAGIVHGNIHPGTVLIADDGRVVLGDPCADEAADQDTDIRAIGAVLYSCLTAHWPLAEAGASRLPDAPRDAAGRLPTPRQVRGGIPKHLDEIATELLDGGAPLPPAANLAAEFARLAGHDNDFDDVGPMGFGAGEPVTKRRAGKLAFGIAVLTAIALIGAITGVKLLTGDDQGANTPALGSTPSTQAKPSTANGRVITIGPDHVRIVDPPKGDRAEIADADLVVDGNEATGWSTQTYNRPNFGGLKPGMGVLIDLGAPKKVQSVRVLVGQQGASIALRAGTSDPGNTSAGDKTIASDFVSVGQPLDDHSGTVMVFPVPDDQQEVQFLLVWVTELPTVKDGKFALAINEITVFGP